MKDVLYLGDTKLDQAASYLAGIMTYFSIRFDYLSSNEYFKDNMLKKNYKTIIISDYPAKNFSPSQLQNLAKLITGGTNLIMIGGWESFTGKNIEYTHTPIKDILPVVMQPTDDRINSYHPLIIEKVQDHPILQNLPFDSHPTYVGGFNKLLPRESTQTILRLRKINICRKDNNYTITLSEDTFPLLVIGQAGNAKSIVFTSDVAPHWVGGLVDWGNTRITAKANNAEEIEVGNWYAQLFANIIKWTLS